MTLVSYIIRRLIAAVGLVIVISMVTFAIFYLIPRLAGATPGDPGRALRGPVHGLGGDPADCREARVLRPGAGAVLELGQGRRRRDAPTTTAPGWRSARRRAWATRSAAASRCSPTSMRRLPVTLSLAVGAAIIWLVVGVSVGVLSALKRGSFFDRFAMTIALAGVSLPIFWTGLVALSLFSYQLGWTPPGSTYTPFTENPREVGLRPDAAVDHARPALLRAVRAAHPRGHAGDHGGGLHPHGAGEGPQGTTGSSSSTASAAR